MKKASLIALTIFMVAALFTGCRRAQPDTTAPSTAPKTTTAAPAPTTVARPKPSMTLPSPTDLMPSGTGHTGPADGGQMGRGRMGPRL